MVTSGLKRRTRWQDVRETGLHLRRSIAEDELGDVWGTTAKGLRIYGTDVPVAATDTCKVLMAPLNIAGQPQALQASLQRQGVYTRRFQFEPNPLGFGADLLLDPQVHGRQPSWDMMLDVSEYLLAQDFDIHHYWHKPLLHNPGFSEFTGFDLPFAKAAGKKLVHRFTGWDLRHHQENLEFNPHSAFRYGYVNNDFVDDEGRERWLEYLHQFVDAFVVVDHEMQHYCPDAHIVPRSLTLSEWPCEPYQSTDVPLLLHFPTDPAYKGTRFFRKAVEQLRDEGLRFRYEELQKVSHQTVRDKLRQTDIVLDQLHLGWYGVGAMEAMALGRPVVTYINDELASRFGETVPVANANPENLVRVLRTLIQDNDWRRELATKGRAFVEQHHDAEHVAGQLKTIYTDLLGDREKQAARSAPVQRPVSMGWMNRQLGWSYRSPWTRMGVGVYRKFTRVTRLRRLIRRHRKLRRLSDAWRRKLMSNA